MRDKVKRAEGEQNQRKQNTTDAEETRAHSHTQDG